MFVKFSFIFLSVCLSICLSFACLILSKPCIYAHQLDVQATSKLLLLSLGFENRVVGTRVGYVIHRGQSHWSHNPSWISLCARYEIGISRFHFVLFLFPFTSLMMTKSSVWVFLVIWFKLYCGDHVSLDERIMSRIKKLVYQVLYTTSSSGETDCWMNFRPLWAVVRVADA